MSKKNVQKKFFEYIDKEEDEENFLKKNIPSYKYMTDSGLFHSFIIRSLCFLYIYIFSYKFFFFYFNNNIIFIIIINIII